MEYGQVPKIGEGGEEKLFYFLFMLPKHSVNGYGEKGPGVVVTFC